MKPWKMPKPSDRTSFRICLLVLLKCLDLGPALTFSVQTLEDRPYPRGLNSPRFVPPPLDDEFRGQGFSRELKEALTNSVRDKKVFNSCYGWGPGCNGRSRMFNGRRDFFSALNHQQQQQSLGSAERAGRKRNIGGISMREKKIEFLEQILEDLLEDDDSLTPVYD